MGKTLRRSPHRDGLLMNLYTRCPACATIFRVTTQQLQVSGGQVRCGNCHEVFDGFATLTAQEPQEVLGSDVEDLRTSAADIRPSPRPANGKTDAASIAPPRAAAVLPDPAAALYEWEFRMPENRQRAGLWLSLSLLLLLAFGVQAAFFYRNEILVTIPAARGLYGKACAVLGCPVGLPRLSGYLHIETSDLRVPDPEHPNEIELLVSVRNRAPIELAFPSFELTLTDSNEQTIARRVFMPSEYAKDRARGVVFPAGTELPVRLFLDTGTLRAAGYRVYLFYP